MCTLQLAIRLLQTVFGTSVAAEGIENWTEEQLAEIVTCDCMIGVASVDWQNSRR